MKLLKYRVTNFRSVTDSDWIEVDAVTALIGENESGKSNLLLPLWKLNPASEGEIQPRADYPKKLFGPIRDNPGAFQFISARFTCDDEEARYFASALGLVDDATREVEVTRYYDGGYTVAFPLCDNAKCVDAAKLQGALAELSKHISTGVPTDEEADAVALLQGQIKEFAKSIPVRGLVSAEERANSLKELSRIAGEAAKISANKPLIISAVNMANNIVKDWTKPHPDDEATVGLAVKTLPKFVYYSNYGNLDSEIYLPHVVQNLAREDLGAKEAAKARTLRVLFKFVGLDPKEILELGKDAPNQNLTEDAIRKAAGAKQERFILMQSAENSLTTGFREWWKRGDYNFTLHPDGDHFRIYVSDDRRPEKVELESRSTGLQWFLSFFLVFLVESKGAHKSAILLLDEPGMSLHPLAQRDLSNFFDGLAATNQLIYTSHSPFLIQADRLDRARKVYVDASGATRVSADLRESAAEPRKGAAYAVHSALNLDIAESLLIGCTPIVVDGPSDQHYLTTIKTLLISNGEIKPSSELVFPSAGGAKTARITASILTGRDEQLPIILADDDTPGRSAVRDLRSSLYAETPERVLSLKDFVFEGAEVEDLFPPEFLAEVADRLLPRGDVDLRDEIHGGVPFVNQVEAWAKANGLNLPEHWKVKLSLEVKKRALKVGVKQFDTQTVARWKKLFDAFLEAPIAAKPVKKRAK